MKRTQGSQSERGMLYQYAVTALLAAKLSENNQVQDYIIYSSENSAGTFDDIVARIKIKDQNDWYLFLIQVKHKKNKNLNVSDNLKGKKIEYFISKYIQCFNEILRNPELSCRRDIPSDNIRFAIFCNRGIQTPVFLRQERTFQINLCSISEQNATINNILFPFGNQHWKFVCTDVKASEYQNFFERCCLYLEQPNFNEINKQIKETCNNYNTKEIINFVNEYFNQDDLHKQGLTKEVFEVELQKIRFFQDIPPITSLEDLVNDGRVGIFNDITLKHDITAISCMPNFVTEACLYSCLVQRLNNLLNIETDWKKHISNKNEMSSNVIDKFKVYSAKKKYRYWIDEPHTLQYLLIEMWKCGDLPLIVKTYPDLNNFKKYSHLNRNYIIIDDRSTQFEELHPSELKIFSCLSNCANPELKNKMLNKTLASLQGRKPIPLKKLLLDDELMSTFACVDILKMMRKKIPFLNEDCFKGSNYLVFIVENEDYTEISRFIEPYIMGHNIKISCPRGKIHECIKVIQSHGEIYDNYKIYHLEQKGNKLVLTKGDPDKIRHYFVDQYEDPLYFNIKDESVPIIGQSTKPNELQYIDRQLRRPTLSSSFFTSQETQICLLSGDIRYVERYTLFCNIDDIINATIMENKTYFLKIDDMKSREDYWCKLCHLGYPIFDTYINNDQFELLRFQHCKNLEPYISYCSRKYSENNFLDELKDKSTEITVVTGDAGIGKTSFLKWICNNYSTTDYIVFYDLINLQRDLNENKSYQNLIKCIFKKIKTNVRKKYIKYISSLWRKKKVVWMLDSFDEIRLACEEQVLDFIRLIVKSEAQIIIATRTENCKVLMEQFGVRLIKINPLEKKECLSYWQLDEELLDNVSSELVTNPLYLNFLKVISINREQIKNINKFTLYEKFIHMKVRNCLQRTYRVLYDCEVERYVSLLERLALVVMFGQEIIQQELYWTSDKEVSDMTKFGIITHFDEDGYPTFYHSTFVEFLVAYWMTKAHQINVYKSTARNLYRHICDENKLHILNIVFEDVKLHKNILQLDTVIIEKIAERDVKCWNIVDKLGRTALHAAVINCRSPNRLSETYNMLEIILKFVLESSCDISQRDTIMDWNWSEYFHPEMFEFAYVFDKINVIKAYLQLHRQKVEKTQCPTMVFPANYMYVLLRTAVESISINMIADIVWLQNFENKMFRSFYVACLELVPEATVSCATEIQLEGKLTPIHIACIYGSIPMIQYLIKAGVDVNAVDELVCTPLRYSIMRSSLFRSENLVSTNERSKNESAVNLLLKANATPKPFVSSAMITPLYLAVQTMNANVVRMLLEAGANLNHRYKNGNVDIDLCLEHCKHMSISKNKHCNTTMEIEQNCKEIIELLKKKWNPTDDKDLHKNIYVCTPLDDAIYTGNIHRVKKLLTRGGDINLPNSNGFVPLHIAIITKNTEVVTLLLNEGADVEVQDKRNRTSLFIAIANNYITIIQIILKKGADPNTVNMFGETPLRMATINKNVNTVKLLLKTGANVNFQFKDGSTSLYVAAALGYEDIAMHLLSNEADTEISDVKGMTPLHMSIIHRHKKVCELLLQNGANANAHTKQIVPPFLLSILWEDIDIISLLLEKGAIVNSADMDGYMALHDAARLGNEDIVRLLLEKGANINAQTCKGESALYIAANEKQARMIVFLMKEKIDIDPKGGAATLWFFTCVGHINAVKFLLNRGINVNSRNLEDYTALHLAALNGRRDIVDLLLKNGARVNARTEFGCTPLHHAIVGIHEDVVKLLIDAGADVSANCKLTNLNLHHACIKDFKSVNYYNKDDCTAFFLAIETKNINIIELLFNAMISHEDWVEALQVAVDMRDVNIITLLLNKDINLNIYGKTGFTPLHLATIKGYADIVELLLNNGAKVNVPSKDGTVPFSRAVCNGNIEITRLLLKNGANVDTPIGSYTALLRRTIKQDTDFVKMLLEQGADVNFKHTDGFNALEIAVAESKTTDLVEVLLQGGATVNAPISSGDSILMVAIQRGNIQIIKVLLEKEIDFNYQNNFGYTALHIGVLEKNSDVIALLLDKGADADIPNYNNETPFHFAVHQVCVNTVKFQSLKANIIWLLLENMKKIDVSDKDVIQTFYWAAAQGHMKIIELLLDKGMNVNFQDQHGRTPLHIAINSSNYDIVEILLEKGADIHLKSNDGSTPLNFAQLIQIVLKKSAKMQKSGNTFK